MKNLIKKIISIFIRIKEMILKKPIDKTILHEVTGSASEDNPKEENFLENMTETSIANFFDNKNSNFDPDQVEKIMETILNLAWNDVDLKKHMEPAYILRTKKKTAWLFSVSKKCFFEFKDKTELSTVEEISDTISYCIINNDVFEVENDMIHYIGWN